MGLCKPAKINDSWFKVLNIRELMRDNLNKWQTLINFAA